MPQLQVYSSPDLPPDLKCQIVSFIRIEWWWAFTGSNRFWDYTKKSTHPANVVLVEQGLVISHAEVNWRMLDHVGQQWKMYGLSAVFTYPAWRREGHGERVVRAATEQIDQSDADVAMLFCLPNLTPFYKRCGWEHMADTTVLRGDPQQPARVDDEAVMMRFVGKRAQQARQLFADQPLYVGRHTW